MISKVETLFSDEIDKAQVTELLTLALDSNTSELIKHIKTVTITDTVLGTLIESIPFETFTAKISHYLDTSARDTIKSITILHSLSSRLSDDEMDNEEKRMYWKGAIGVIQSPNKDKKVIDNLVRIALTSIDKDVAIIHDDIEGNGIKLPKILKETLVSKNNFFKLIQETEDESPRDFFGCKNLHDLEALCYTIITTHKTPSWYISNNLTAVHVFEAIIKNYPSVLYSVIKHRIISISKLFILIKKTKEDNLFEAIISLNPSQSQAIKRIVQFYKTINLVPIKGLTSGKIGNVVLKALIDAWISGRLEQNITNNYMEPFIIGANYQGRGFQTRFYK